MKKNYTGQIIGYLVVGILMVLFYSPNFFENAGRMVGH